MANDGVEIREMEYSIRAVEVVLNYKFKNKRLLEDALTHPSYTGSDSYQRLEFVGDAALSLAITNFVFLEYKDLEPGELSLVRAANISTEKLARVAVRHRLYRYVRHNATALDAKVRAFVAMVEKEDDTVVYGGAMKAPKVLADIVESIAAAVYVDLGFDLKQLWMVIRSLLEPIFLLDQLQQRPQPVTLLFELCQKDGNQVDIQHQRKGDENIATVFVNGVFVASASSEKKENAKLRAATAALVKMPNHLSHTDDDLDEAHEIEGAKQKLNEVCSKRKWRNPSYSIAKEEGPAHEKKYICSVKFEALEHEVCKVGNAKPRLKDAENSAASVMLHWLRRHAYI